jgi:hypothetical protein
MQKRTGFRFLSTLLISTIVTLLVAGRPTLSDEPNCNAALDLVVTGLVDELGRPRGAEISNQSSVCSYSVGAASYKLYGSEEASQLLWQAREDILPPLSQKNFWVHIPSCGYRLEVFHGPLIVTFRTGSRYLERTLKSDYYATELQCPEPTCEEAIERDIVGTILPLSEEDPRCGRMTNFSSSCSYTVGIASYNVFDPPPLFETQTLFDSFVTQVAPNSTTELCVSRPACSYQLDLFVGQVVAQPASGESYGIRLRDAGIYVSGSRPYCSIDPTPTPTPTATPTPTPTPAPSLICQVQGSANPLPCNGESTSLQLSGAGSSSFAGISYEWSSTCPNTQLSDPAALAPILSFSSAQENGAPVSCQATLQVKYDALGIATSCSVPISVSPCSVDCAGQINGSAIKDRCGVCLGSGESCLAGCSTSDLREGQIRLDGHALQLRTQVSRLFALTRPFERSKKAALARKAALERANSLYAKAWTVSWSVPRFVTQCSVSSICVTTSFSDVLDEYLASIQELEQLTAEARDRATRAYPRRIRTRIDNARRIALAIGSAARKEVSTLPRTNVICP